MKKSLLGILGSAVLVISASQLAVAAPHHDRAKNLSVSTAQKFRNANGSVGSSSPAQPYWSNDGEAGIAAASAGR